MEIHDIEDMTPAHPPPGNELSTAELGCFHNTLATAANVIHLTQGFAGIVVLSYAIAISFHKPDPQHGIATILEIYAVLLIMASMAVFGVSKPNCKRITLKISAWVAPFLSVLYILAFLLLLVDKSSVKKYLVEKEHQLFLSDRELEFIVSSHCSYILFMMFSLEGLRFYILQKLKNNLDEYDVTQRSEMLQDHARRASAARNRWETNPQNDNRRSLITPLLESPDNRATSSGDVSFTSSMKQKSSIHDESAASWWEEPAEDQSSSLNDSSSGGWWISRAFNKVPSNCEGVEEVKEDCGVSTCSEGFAPIDGEIETGATPWHESSNSTNRAESDLSWAKEETDL